MVAYIGWARPSDPSILDMDAIYIGLLSRVQIKLFPHDFSQFGDQIPDDIVSLMLSILPLYRVYITFDWLTVYSIWLPPAGGS